MLSVGKRSNGEHDRSEPFLCVLVGGPLCGTEILVQPGEKVDSSKALLVPYDATGTYWAYLILPQHAVVYCHHAKNGKVEAYPIERYFFNYVGPAN